MPPCYRAETPSAGLTKGHRPGYDEQASPFYPKRYWVFGEAQRTWSGHESLASVDATSFRAARCRE